jgi:hypothetical protein
MITLSSMVLATMVLSKQTSLPRPTINQKKGNKMKKILLALSLALCSHMVAAQDAPTTLLSAGTISPYQAQRNGLYMAADFLAAVPANTRFKISTQPWMDTTNNTVVISVCLP